MAGVVAVPEAGLAYPKLGHRMAAPRGALSLRGVRMACAAALQPWGLSWHRGAGSP